MLNHPVPAAWGDPAPEQPPPPPHGDGPRGGGDAGRWQRRVGPQHLPAALPKNKHHFWARLGEPVSMETVRVSAPALPGMLRPAPSLACAALRNGGNAGIARPRGAALPHRSPQSWGSAGARPPPSPSSCGHSSPRSRGPGSAAVPARRLSAPRLLRRRGSAPEQAARCHLPTLTHRLPLREALLAAGVNWRC